MLFDDFISEYFNGYSAHTLYKYLCITSSVSCKEVFQNWVYVSLYKVFTDKATKHDEEIYDLIRRLVYGYTEQDEELFLLELGELKYCLLYGYSYANAAWLKEQALTWFLRHSITLSDFKLIVSM